MCNLYSVSRSQDEIRRIFEIDDDRAGNLPPLAGIFPHQMSPVIGQTEAGRRSRFEGSPVLCPILLTIGHESALARA